jgi:hypothetical protein
VIAFTGQGQNWRCYLAVAFGVNDVLSKRLIPAVSSADRIRLRVRGGVDRTIMLRDRSEVPQLRIEEPVDQ